MTRVLKSVNGELKDLAVDENGNACEDAETVLHEQRLQDYRRRENMMIDWLKSKGFDASMALIVYIGLPIASDIAQPMNMWQEKSDEEMMQQFKSDVVASGFLTAEQVWGD